MVSAVAPFFDDEQSRNEQLPSPTIHQESVGQEQYVNEILILISAPLLTDDNKPIEALNIQNEIDEIVDVLEEISNSIKIKVTVKIATSETLLKIFSRRLKPLIIHFIGHGDIIDENHALILENETGLARPYLRTEFRSLLSTLEYPPCKIMILNACYSEGMGQELLKANVPHVIAINAEDRISDIAAQAFSKIFYYAVFNEESIETAFKRGCESVKSNDALCNLIDLKTLQKIYGQTESIKFRLLPEYSRTHKRPLSLARSLIADNDVIAWKNTNLWAEDTNFFGRRQDLHNLLKILHSKDKHCLSVHGMGGMGKTSLAQALGRWLHERNRFKDGVWLIELQDVKAISDALNRLQITLRFQLDNLQFSNLFQHLDSKNCFLILDDIDELLYSDPEGTKRLLKALSSCRRIKFVVTSRRGLPSPILASAENYELSTLDKVDASIAFLHYAPCIDQWQKTENAEDDYQALLNFLVGYPFPILLAATYMRETRCSLQTLIKRLNIDSLKVFKPGSDKETRENSLRATLDLSYNALPNDAKKLFPILALFPDGISKNMANCILDHQAIDTLATLVNYSMAEHRDVNQEWRVHLPKPARHYAKSKLEGRIKQELEYFAPVVLKYFYTFILEVNKLDKTSPITKERLQPELSNLNFFLSWGYESEANPKSISYSARITALLEKHWKWMMPDKYYILSLDKALSRSRIIDDKLGQAEVLICQGHLLRSRIGLNASKNYFYQAVDVYHNYAIDLDDPVEQAAIKLKIGEIYNKTLNSDKALSAYKEAYEIYFEHKLTLLAADTLLSIGNIYHSIRDFRTALKQCEAALSIYISIPNEQGISQAQNSINNLKRLEVEDLGTFTEIISDSVIMELVKIPSGEFFMGAPDSEELGSESERPQFRATVATFFMSKFLVTQEQWEVIMGSKPSSFKGANRPVETISWHDADEFCKKLSRTSGTLYRLPSEAEWEYACRAGTLTPFYFGETITTNTVNFKDARFREESRIFPSNYDLSSQGKNSGRTSEVGSFPKNVFGIYDMHGNVWEWCYDTWHANYKGAPTDGSAWVDKTDTEFRVIRGGSWCDLPGYCRSAYRIYSNPSIRRNFIGFRVVCSVPSTL